MKVVYNTHMGGGSHLPILIKLVGITDGPILELGMGLFSTPYLHWVCYNSKRKLVSYETKLSFLELFTFNDKREKDNDYSYHSVNLVGENGWDAIDISEHWSIVLIDHAPGPRRKEEIKRVANSADYIIVHDTEARNDWYYKYSEVYDLFKYKYDYTLAFPQTTVLSNIKDLSVL